MTEPREPDPGSPETPEAQEPGDAPQDLVPKSRGPRPPWWRGRIVVGTLALFLGIGLGGAGGGSGTSATESAAAAPPEPAPTVTVTAPPEPAPTVTVQADPKPAKTVKVKVPGPEKTVTVTAKPPEPKAAMSADGTYLIGTDIKPGTYRADGGGDLCYWARLSGLSGELDDIIANHAGSANTTVEISAGDKAFITRSCGTWTALP